MGALLYASGTHVCVCECTCARLCESEHVHVSVGGCTCLSARVLRSPFCYLLFNLSPLALSSKQPARDPGNGH